jgi:hypothetical protein
MLGKSGSHPVPEIEKPPTMWTVGQAHTGGVYAYSIMTTTVAGMDIASPVSRTLTRTSTSPGPEMPGEGPWANR